LNVKGFIAFCVTLVIGSSAFGVGGPVAAQPSASPVAAQPSAGPAAPQSSGRSCFRPRDVRSFGSADNRTVFVRVTGRDIFALELFAPCLGANWTRDVALRTRGSSQICDGRANWVNLYVRQTGGRGQQRCSVRNVRRLTPEDVANLPRGARPF
jgi:hypothetical protein